MSSDVEIRIEFIKRKLIADTEKYANGWSTFKLIYRILKLTATDN